MNDNIERILDDCTLHPAEYASRRYPHKLDEKGRTMADWWTDMCSDLVGRTIAVMGANRDRSGIYDWERDRWYRHGDHVIDKVNGSTGTVIGFATGDDCRKCLVIDTGRKGWQTYLVPMERAAPYEPTSEGVMEALDRNPYNLDAGCLLKLVEDYIKAKEAGCCKGGMKG